MSYPSPGPAGPPQPAASAYPAGGQQPQPNVLGNHPVPGQRRNRQLLIGIVVVVLMAIAGLAIFAIVADSTGAGGFTWGMAFAMVPVIPVIGLYLWLDRYEPEPTRYILFALCWGAFIATLVAIFINTEVAKQLAETGAGGDRSAIFVAPPVEEFAKGSVILLLALVRRKEFDGIIDGLVYAGMVGVGFAFTENILYYGRIFSELSNQAGSDAGLRGVLVLFILRGVMSPFAHPLFTSFTAIGIGIAVRHRSTAVRFLAPVVGFLAAVLAHAAWNASASWAEGTGFLLAYFLLMVPIFVGMVIFALVLRSREGKMIASRLYDYVRFGWLVAPEVPLIATMRGRKALRQNARRYGGQAEAAAKAFQANATDLAYLRDKIVRQVIGPEALQDEKRLLDELRARRASVPFPPMPAFPQAMPPGGQSGPGGPGAYGPPQPGPGSWPGGGGVQGGAVQTGPAPGGPGAGGYGAPQPGYPSGQPGYPASQPGYPSGPPGSQGSPGGYGPYPPSQ